MRSWQPMVRSMLNYCQADRIDSYTQGFIQGEYCTLRWKGAACPLNCSPNRSASVGYPWKEDKPSQRRGKKNKPFSAKRTAYEMHSSNLPTLKQQRPWYKLVNSDVLQQALHNQNKAFQNFFSAKAKFPRFKKISDINFEFKPGTVKLDRNRIKFPTLGWMRFHQSRKISSSWAVRTVTLTQEADGWYTSVLLKDDSILEVPLKKVDQLRSVNGVDRGIAKITAQASGAVTVNPRISKQFERRLQLRQRRLSRKKKGSRNRAKAALQVKRVHQKVRRVRDDFQWKLALLLAQSADVVGFEDLNIKGMKARCKPRWDEGQKRYLKNRQTAKSQLNKAISDAAWGNLLLKTKHQAQKLGNWVVEVPCRYTSTECSSCHYVSPKNRVAEKFVCENCGHCADADVDAAVVIAQRTREVVGLPNLPLVKRKVMPVSELTETHLKELSLPLGGEPGNRSRKGEYAVSVQLSLFDYLSEESPAIPNSG